jgi:hypothetical protein
MAKTITGVTATLQLRRHGDGTWRLAGLSYGDPLDDASPDVRYVNNYNAAGGDLDPVDLAGTLANWLSGQDAAYKTANGIA